MASLADKAILSGVDNRPPMLEKDMYDSWKSGMELYMLNRPHGRMILESVEQGLFLWPSVEVEGVTRLKKYFKLSAAEAIQVDCDVKATNIILQGLPPEVYTLVSTHKVAPQIEYAPIAYNPSEFSSPVVPVFQKGDDPIDAINHMMSFFTSVVASRVTIQPIQGRQNYMSTGSSRPFASGLGGTSGKQRVIVCYNCKEEGHMSKQCTKPKRKRDAKWFIDKADDLDAYDLDCDELNSVKNSTLPALQDDLILSVIEQLKTHVVNYTKVNQDNKQVNELLTAELERYRNQERILTTQMNDDNKSTSYAHSMEIDTLKHTLSEHLKEKEYLEQKITLLKNDFQKEESRNIDRELALEKEVKELNNIVFKRNQSGQTVHMLTKPQVFYNHATRQALGFQNPCYLKKAQQLKLNMYDGSVIRKSNVILVPDSKDTLMLAEESRSKMIENHS
nr:hypothetical protein [Tanacetum cinerariifolium]